MATNAMFPYRLPTGFDVRQGSTDPALNQRIYGQNYFPGTLPGFEQVKNSENFFALSPEQQGDYRQALYNQTNVNRVNPFYMPEEWNYKESPEYQWRLQQALKNANRQNLALGRQNSTFGLNAMNRVASDIAAEEVDKQYQRAAFANQQNWNRMFGTNVENYGRGFREGEQDWNRNYALAQLGFGATTAGVNSGNAMAGSVANLLSHYGATDALLALSRGDVNADFFTQLLTSGMPIAAINAIFKPSSGGAVQQTLPTTFNSQAGLQTPTTTTARNNYIGSSYGGGAATPGRDFFA